MKHCPYCAEEIQNDAIVCKHCQRALDGSMRTWNTANPPATVRTWSPGVAAILSFFIPGLGHVYKGRLLAGVTWFVLTLVGYALMIVPGIALHLFVIYEAYNGPSKDELARKVVEPA